MVKHAKPASFYDVFTRKGEGQKVTHYCPGCGHGTAHKLLAEAIDELGIQDRVVLCSPVGCSVFAYYYFDTGNVQCAHGRAPAVATGLRRALKGAVIVSYQGDGDLAGIGLAEIVHAANRGESLTVFFINNAIYGMTGGQMAPTTLLGQKTTTTPFGRTAEQEGFPMRVCELLGSLEAPAYLERVALGDAKHDMATRRAVRKAIQNQVEGKGFSLVEVLSPCPTGWKQIPTESAKFVLDTMTRTFPLGVVRDTKPSPDGPRHAPTGVRTQVPLEKVPEILKLEPAETAGGGKRADGWSMEGVDPRFRNPRIKAAGFGGQGVLFVGALIAEAGMLAGWEVSWLPSYGPEMRGGTAHCHVILSNSQVDSPLVTRTSVLFAFNRPSLERFLGDVADDGLVIYDSSLVHDFPSGRQVEAIGIPATRIAEGLGSGRVANLVALGAYLRRTKTLPPAAVEAALKAHTLKPEAIALNMRALEEGMRFSG